MNQLYGVPLTEEVWNKYIGNLVPFTREELIKATNDRMDGVIGPQEWFSTYRSSLVKAFQTLGMDTMREIRNAGAPELDRESA